MDNFFNTGDYIIRDNVYKEAIVSPKDIVYADISTVRKVLGIVGDKEFHNHFQYMLEDADGKRINVPVSQIDTHYVKLSEELGISLFISYKLDYG